MTVLTVTQQINEDVSVKTLAVLNGQTHSVYQGLWVITVYVQYRCKDHLSNIRTVGG